MGRKPEPETTAADPDGVDPLGKLGGSTPVQLTERQRWEHRNKDETWSILLTQDTVILQPRPTPGSRTSSSGCSWPSTPSSPSPNTTSWVWSIVQNDQGSSLPPDVVDAAPSFSPGADAGELVTLIDMDHFVEGNFDADPDWVVARAYELHDHIIETFHNHVVTEDAIKEWK